MLLDQCRFVNEISHPVRGEDVLQFKTENARDIRLFYIEVIVVIVEIIDDPYPERIGISE